MSSQIERTSALCCCLVVFCCFQASAAVSAQAAVESAERGAAVQSVDPNKAPSEFNHHLAGWALIGVGLVALAGQGSPRFKAFNYVMPALFIAVGLFLATWSDGEMWPRGNLNWLWLLHHDAEARQHKVYALLLVAMGVLEYFRIRGSLRPLWRTWAFLALALLGAAMLLVHDHTAGSGANLPEAQAYLVNPTLNVDGSPRKPRASSSGVMENYHTHDEAALMPASASSMEHEGMPMDHSHMMMQADANETPAPAHHHVMSASMMLVESEHFWFMILGVGIALFKFISDGNWFRTRVVSCLWPAGMLALGVALTLYRE